MPRIEILILILTHRHSPCLDHHVKKIVTICEAHKRNEWESKVCLSATFLGGIFITVGCSPIRKQQQQQQQ